MIEFALTNVPFDNSYANVLRFDNESARNAYFQIPDIFANSQTYNFNVGEFYITSKRMQFSNIDVQTLMTANYALIHDLESGKYFFYFITKSSYLGGKSVELSLELDIFQTYYLSTTFSLCNIRRTCLPRFEFVDDETVKFSTGVDSLFYLRDDIQDVAKRMTKRTVLHTTPSSDTTVNQWFNDNVVGWNIYFVQSRIEGSQDGYKFYSIANAGETAKYIPPVPFSSDFGWQGILPIAFEPIYKGTKKILLHYGATGTTVPTISDPFIVLSEGGFEGFRRENDNNSFVFASKFVPYTPFDLDSVSLKATIDSGHLIIYSTSTSSYFAGSWGFRGFITANPTTSSKVIGGGEKGQGIAFLSRIPTQLSCEEYVADYQLEFKKSEIIGAQKSSKFNPKLLTADYRTIKLTNEREAGFEYDPLKLGINKIQTAISDPLTPDTTRTYFRVTNTNGVYIPECSQNLTGFVDSADTSLMVDNDQLSGMLAQNKNYFLQSTFKVLETGAKGLVAGALGGIPAGATAGAGIVSGLVDQYLTIDNMRNSPNEVKNANGSVYFNRMYTECGPTIEEYDILDNEKEIINDYNVRFGFAINRLGDIKSCDHMRKYFDFVLADVELVTNSTAISNQVRDKFKEIFANGVRFWHDPTKFGDYSLENYERYLEE